MIFKFRYFLILFIFFPSLAFASSGSHNFISHLLTGLILIILGAKIGGEIAIRLGQPAVLGELLFGLIIGNLSYIGFDALSFIKVETSFDILSELGVILLLFQVGLETNLNEMRRVGLSALVVAILGVFFPFILGYGVSSYFIPSGNVLAHVFVGATLTATSVGITARVLKDLGKIQSGEGQVILGAAVIDDVLGLLTLAVVTGLITSVNTGQEFEVLSLVKTIGLASGFLVSAIVLGRFVSPKLFSLANRLHSEGLLLATSLFICFGLSLLAQQVGLAPIVGAFTAGLILDPIHYKSLQERTGDESIENLISPISSLLVPVFFVIMGAKVDLGVFTDFSIINYALFLSLAAIIGKQVCALGVLDKGLDRMAVGLGMIPRGEVGLIFVGIGAGLSLNGEPIIDRATFGAVVIMVIITTMITPPLIKWKFSKIIN